MGGIGYWARRAGPGIALLLVVGLSGCLRAVRRVAAQASTPDVVASGDPGRVPAGVREALADAVRRGAKGVTAIVMRDGKELYRLDVGRIDPDARYPVASASKWMTAALVMTVVDEGRLSLDEPIAKHLPEFQGEKGRTTLRHLLAQTSGQGSLKGRVDIRQDARLTLAESAAEVARLPLEHPPGTVFAYGGPGFQVAGALVEKVTGRRWADLFQARIAGPLGMERTSWGHPTGRVPPGQTSNPLLQGGVTTTAGDYMRFLSMLAQGGVHAGHRVLSAQAVRTMETVQTLGMPKDYLPPGIPADSDPQYALGNWCETWSADGQGVLVSSPGALGTYPWIDRKSGLCGIFFTKHRLPKVRDDFLKARAAILRGIDG